MTDLKEYLMTYGWAIMIVIIVALALWFLGMFDPQTYIQFENDFIDENTTNNYTGIFYIMNDTEVNPSFSHSVPMGIGSDFTFKDSEKTIELKYDNNTELWNYHIIWK